VERQKLRLVADIILNASRGAFAGSMLNVISRRDIRGRSIYRVSSCSSNLRDTRTSLKARTQIRILRVAERGFATLESFDGGISDLSLSLERERERERERLKAAVEG